MEKGDTVLITKGKFKGWHGDIQEKEKEGKETYYTIFADYKKTKTGTFRGSDVGLGQIINIPESHVKKPKKYWSR